MRVSISEALEIFAIFVDPLTPLPPFLSVLVMSSKTLSLISPSHTVSPVTVVALCSLDIVKTYHINVENRVTEE